jgi:hypothetical protein
MTEQEYRALDRVSYSGLKTLASSPRAYLKRDQQEATPALSLGSLVDCLATTPDLFNDNYFILTSVPTASIKAVIDGIVEEGAFFADDPILRHCNYTGFQTRWKDETRIAKIKEEGEEYYETLMKAKGKLIISVDDYDNATRIVDSIRESEFGGLINHNREDVELFFQQPVEWEFNHISCKSLFDIVKVDHKQECVQIIDLKTTSKSVYNFDFAVKTYRYDLQAAFYQEALDTWMKNKNITEYQKLPFSFLVVETFGLNPPMLWTSSPNLLHCGKYGGFFRGSHKPVQGFVQLLDDYAWHKETDNWDYRRDIGSIGFLDPFEEVATLEL